jgi:hypothetical protein
VSVDGGEALGTHVAGGEVTTLEHELGDDAVEGSALEVKGLAAAALALLSGAESAEVLSSLWPDTLVDNLWWRGNNSSHLGDNIGTELHDDAAKRLTAGGDVEEDLGVGHVDGVGWGDENWWCCDEMRGMGRGSQW